MKVKLLALMLLVSAVATAGGYRHSFGITLGTVNGLSYKGYVSNNMHFVLQVDAYWQMGLTPNWLLWREYSVGELKDYTTNTQLSTVPSSEYQSAMVNPSFMYQGKIGRWDFGNMYWFAGAGVGVGAIWSGKFDKMSRFYTEGNSRPWFKMSEQLMAGVELSFNGAPLVLGIELRPGMAQTYIVSGKDLYNNMVLSGLMFDWGANFSLRYCFGNEKLDKK